MRHGHSHNHSHRHHHRYQPPLSPLAGKCWYWLWSCVRAAWAGGQGRALGRPSCASLRGRCGMVAPGRFTRATRKYTLRGTARSRNLGLRRWGRSVADFRRTCARARLKSISKMRMPGVEPGSQAWEACMIPLHYMRPDIMHSPSFSWEDLEEFFPTGA